MSEILAPLNWTFSKLQMLLPILSPLTTQHGAIKGEIEWDVEVLIAGDLELAAQ